MWNGALMLAGKVALVTGASRGIGLAIARRFAQQGAQVAGVARSAAPREDLALAIAADLREIPAAERIRNEVLATLGRIDILVNCAGAAKRGDFLEFTEDDWVDGFALKFSGARRLTARCWPELHRSGGSVLNIVGAAGRTPGIDYSLAGPVNAALLALTKALAERGGRDGVQVNAINPGPVRTDRTMTSLAVQAAQKGIGLEQAVREMVRAFGMTRLGEPEDVAALATFIVSPEGRWLHGALIDIDGGQTKSL